MTGSLASGRGEGGDAPSYLPASKRRRVLLLSERAERARAKDLLFPDVFTESRSPSHRRESSSFAPAAVPPVHRCLRRKRVLRTWRVLRTCRKADPSRLRRSG